MDPQRLIERLGRAFDHVADLSFVGIGPVLGGSTPEWGLYASPPMSVYDGNDIDALERIHRRVLRVMHRVARTLGVQRVFLISAPPTWILLLYRREGPDWANFEAHYGDTIAPAVCPWSKGPRGRTAA